MIIILLLLLFLYEPSISIFFSGDDWFHLRVSNIANIHQFLNFFSFSRNEQTIAFYRPLSTQVFFFTFQKLFGLNPIPFHIFSLIVFGVSVYIFKKISSILFTSETQSLVATIVFAFASSNITRIYFLSHFQEIALVFLSLLALYSYMEGHRYRTILFFILALMSKETAVVLPAILVLYDWSIKKINFRKLIPFGLVVLPYLYLRFKVFGGADGETYSWIFSPVRALNTFMWYGLWSVGAPELLLDYIGPGLRPIPRFFTDFPFWWRLIIWPLILNIIFILILFIKRIRTVDRQLIIFVASFVVSLCPVLFLPEHKFAVELGLPMVWFSLFIAKLLSENKMVSVAFIASFLILNIPMNILTSQRHYSVGRAIVSKKVYDFVKTNYPIKPQNSYFEFINDSVAYTKEWGSSRQISNSIQGSEMFRYIYHDPNYVVYFEDNPLRVPVNSNKIILSSKKFL